MCADGEELATAVDACHPDVVLVDIRMPPTMTDEAFAWRPSSATHPEVGVIAMSAHADPTYALALLEEARRAARTSSRTASRAAHSCWRRSRPSLRADRSSSPRSSRHWSTGRSRAGAVAARRPHASRARDPRGDGPWSEQRGDRRDPGLTKRAVEKHINSVFAKLDLPLSGDVSRRVRAVLLFLGARTA